MEDLDSFDTLAEISVALAGFTGIVLTLGARSSGELTDLERARIIDLLVAAFGAALFAFVPKVLGSFLESSGDAWRTSHALFAAYHVAGLEAFLRALRTRTVGQVRSDLVLAVLSLPVVASQFAAAFGVFPNDY